MKRQAYQHPELRDANDNIIQEGTYGKESPLVNSDNTGVLDYINNNLEALRDNINGSRIYVKNKDALTTPGDISAMYIAEDTGKWYLWDGSKYIETDNARKIADEAIAARDAAKTSEQNAKTSETNADASKQAAATSAGAAASSQAAAKTSEANAKASESNAAASEQAAATSEANAKTSEQNAKTSENNANASKTAAATSADNAASSANAAANSAKAAADSARVNQADWNQTDDTQTDFIKNKPDVNTYVTKSALASSVTTATGKVTTLTATDSTLTNLTVTGQTTVPTANAGNSSKAIANTEFVAKSLAALVDSAPDQLNTLNELAKALGNDANFYAAITAELAKKLNSTEAADTYATKTEAGVPYQIKRNTAYEVGDVLTSPSLPPGCVIVVTQAGTTGSPEPDWTTIKNNMGGVIADNTVTFYINDTLSKHSVGDIVYKPLTKVTEHEYLLPLDGQTIDGMTYKRLVDYLGTTTLPNLNGRYLRADSTPGQMVEAGLPNITGGAVVVFPSNSTDLAEDVSGAFFSSWKYPDNGAYGGDHAAVNLKFDASRSSTIYGSSATVTPLTYTVRAYICYA